LSGVRRGAGLAAVAALLAGLLIRPEVLQGAGAPGSDLRSGFEDMSRENQALQRDDAANPGMLWVQEALWRAKAAPAGRSCADCHGDAPASMRGVATRYPALDDRTNRAVDLQDRLNLCRTRHQGEQALPLEGQQLLALAAYVALQSRGMPVEPPDDPRLTPSRERGRRLFTQPIGQLNLACSGCHEDHAGRRLAGSTIPQGHPNGYPLYRLEWQGLGSLQRRLRNCMTGVRAEPFPYGSAEYVDLEAYLASRAKGLSLEAPAIRP
jgi:sulfur-oxidizing protein SoxA